MQNILKLLKAINPNCEIWLDSFPYDSTSLMNNGRGVSFSDYLRGNFTGITTNPILISQYLNRTTHSDCKMDDDEKLALVELGSSFLKEIYQKSNGECGYFCYQVSPYNIDDSNKIVSEAKIIAAINPNVMVKIPMSPSGIIAIAELYDAGVPVNATLGFSHIQYIDCMTAIRRKVGTLFKSSSGRRFPRLVVSHMSGRIRRSTDEGTAKYREYVASAYDSPIELSELLIAMSYLEKHPIPNLNFLICSIEFRQNFGSITSTMLTTQYPSKVIFTLPLDLVDALASFANFSQPKVVEKNCELDLGTARELLGDYRKLTSFNATLEEHKKHYLLFSSC